MFESTDKQQSTAPAVNQQKERPAHWFKPGQSGNPKGREKGSKNKITKAFLKALTEDFAEHGVEVIKRLREKDPGLYLRIVAQLVPKNLDINHTGTINVQVVDYADDEYQPVSVTQRKEKKLNGDTAALRD